MPTHALRLKYPVVLVHGLGGRSTYGPFEYFYRFPKLLRDAGNRVLVANLTPFHTIEHRASQLKEQIQRTLPDEKVNLIAHSFGGLDARYLAANFGFTERVASVTTIGTPNKGSPLVDIAHGLVPEPALKAADLLLLPLKNSSRAYQQLTTRYCSEVLPVLAPLMQEVGYFSATSAISGPMHKTALPLFWVPSRVLRQHEGDNDGFVSVSSAKLGEHICTYQGDHYAQIGQFLGRSRGLDYLRFYAEIIERLKREGF